MKEDIPNPAGKTQQQLRQSAVRAHLHPMALTTFIGSLLVLSAVLLAYLGGWEAAREPLTLGAVLLTVSEAVLWLGRR